MKPQMIIATVVVLAVAPAVKAQTIDDLLANHALLGTELDRCKQMGMASTDDTRCKTARAAEQKRFFGNGQDKYTPPSSVDVFPKTPDKLVPAQRQQITSPPNPDAPHG